MENKNSAFDKHILDCYWALVETQIMGHQMIINIKMLCFSHSVMSNSLGLTSLISLLSKGLTGVFYHSLKVSTVWCSAFFMVQLSHPFMTPGMIIALTIHTFVVKVIFLLLNMLSRFVIAFLLRRKHLLISWLQSLSTVILKPKKIKSIIVSIFFPIYLLCSDGTRCHDLSVLNVEF